MADELRFTDSAFRCEVVLTDVAKALYEAASPQFDRLKKISSLGLMAHIEETSQHNRHQHALGLMRIFGKLLQQPKGKGLASAFLWSFWCRLCFGQTGHAALSYDSEKAVLLACHLESEFKEKLRTIVQPVIESLAACSVCTRTDCRIRLQGENEGHIWFDELVANNRWRQLHLWIAARKLLQEERVLSILANQKTADKQQPGFSLPEAIKILVGPNCRWNGPVTRLSSLDYIVRDLAFAGTLGIQLDVDSLVSAAKDENHADWMLLRSLSSYLTQTRYESVEMQMASTLFQRALAELLIDGKVTLDELFGFVPGQSLSDADLVAVVKRRDAGRAVFEAARRTAWRVWVVGTYIEAGRTPLEVERSISGGESGFLSKHTRTRVTCMRLQREHSLALAMHYQGADARPDAIAFLKLCRSFLQKQQPRLDSDQFFDAVFTGLLDRPIRYDLENAAKRLAEVAEFIRKDILRKAADLVNDRSSKSSGTSDAFSIKIGEYEYPVRGDPRVLQINLMHAAIRGDQPTRDRLGVTISSLAETLWNEILTWQTAYFDAEVTKAMNDLVQATQEALVHRIVSDEPNAAVDLELYALLESLKHPGDGVSFRVALPNLIVERSSGNAQNEYDVVSVVLRENKLVEVWVWGVTVEQDLRRKRREDMEKIQHLKDLLGARWADIRVVTCYVHKDGREICREIDGHQDRIADTIR